MKIFANREILILFRTVLAVWAVALALTQGFYVDENAKVVFIQSNDGKETIETLQERLTGRYIAETITDP